MEEILEKLNALVWGVPALAGILGVGLFLTVKTGFVQVRLFPEAMRRFVGMFRGKDKSSFQSLCTALGATVGTGNLVGVAGAICLGGPGSVFWMWVCGFLGMATKYAEAVLAVRYQKGTPGQYRGGPMYIITQGMGGKWKWLACLYCFLGIFAAFGVGNATQINAILTALRPITGGRGNLVMGICLAVLVGAMLSGGAKRIGAAAEKLVPFAAGGYILLCVLALSLRFDRIGSSFAMIFRGAFSPRAVTGGALGSAFCALRVGCARGVFTNEAGMGTAAIAHGGAEVAHPAEQGLMGIMEVFWDTIVICTLTALVILCSDTKIIYGLDEGGLLTSRVFSDVLGSWSGGFLAVALCCFAFATIMGWGLYGLRCIEFLIGPGKGGWFVLVQMGAALAGALLETGIIWKLAETVNGFMAIPNLFALTILSGEVEKLTASRPVK